MQTIIGGTVRDWAFGDSSRVFISANVPFRTARLAFKSQPYDSRTNKGEQRGIVPDRAKKIQKATTEGAYTPTQVHVGVRGLKPTSLVYTTKEGIKTARITLEQGETLPLINGGHRFDAWEQLRKDTEKLIASAENETVKAALEKKLAQIDAFPVDVAIMLNGDTQDDFLNLQNTKNVDTAHMLSLAVHRGRVRPKEEPFMKLALHVAKLANSDKNCSFYNNIRFDSKGYAGYPITSLLARSSSDLSTSLLGLAKVGVAAKWEKPAEKLEVCIATALNHILSETPELTEVGRILTPPPNGTKGAATMYVGIATCLAYRLFVTNSIVPTARDRGALIAAAQDTLNNQVNGNFSGPTKREHMGAFAKAFFADLADVLPMHQKVPIGLLELLSTTAYDVDPLPKKSKETPAVQTTEAAPTTGKKKSGRKPKGWAEQNAAAQLPNADETVVIEETVQ